MAEEARRRRLRPPKATPTVLQLEAAECGAASLAMVLGHFGRFLPLETLRRDCGVSRDGSKASSILKAARSYGLEAKGLKAEPRHVADMPMPAIAFVDFCHFVVVEGVWRGRVYLNDPASGRRAVKMEEFDAMFTGVILVFNKGEGFETRDDRPSLAAALRRRARGVELAVLFVLLAGLALALPGLAVPIFSRVFVDYVLVRGLEDWLTPLLIGLGLTAVLRFFLTELKNWILALAQTRLAIDGAREMFAHILRLPAAFFGARYAGEIATRLSLSDGLSELLTGEAAAIVLNFVSAIFFFALMLFYDPMISAVVFAMSALNLVVVLWSARMVSDGNRKLSIDGGKLSGVEISGILDIETYKAAGAEDSFFQRWSGLHANLTSAAQTMGARLAAVRATPAFLSAFSTAAILTLGGMQIMNGELTIGALVAFQSLAASFTAPVMALTGLGVRLQEIRSFTERTDDLLRQPADPNAVGRDQLIDSLPHGRVELRDVSFGHMPLEPPLISGFSLDLPPGGSVALVGPSGSGKSTLDRIVAGLYEPSGGDVLYDGRPIMDWPRAAFAAGVAYIDQDIVLFEGSVRDNLSLWDDTMPEAQIVQAARDAEIHDVVAARPGGYESKIDEGGRHYSVGHRQRLEIARALAGGPRVIVMDEATSALDPVTEAAIVEHIRARGATLVVIAHRLSTIRDCDEIVVLERGHAVERGRHDDLIAAGGLYTRLIEA